MIVKTSILEKLYKLRTDRKTLTEQIDTVRAQLNATIGAIQVLEDLIRESGSESVQENPPE
jgi:hypothetical protein